MSDSQHSTSPIRTRVQTRRTGSRKPERLYYTDPRLMMTNVRMASALLITLACLPAVSRAECSHGGMFGFGKCCCECQNKDCKGHLFGSYKCDPDCDACKCSQTATSIDGVWRCSNYCSAGEIFVSKSYAVAPCRLCGTKMRFHSAACRRNSKCDRNCGRRRLAVEGLWRCSARPRHTHGIEACKSSNVGDCRKCKSTMVFHSDACRGKGNCDNICGRRRLADTFPDCSVCEGSGKTRSWFLRQPCENCFGIGKVRD